MRADLLNACPANHELVCLRYLDGANACDGWCLEHDAEPVPEQPCPGCEANRIEGWGPNHKPSPYCESGKRPHCTCDMCF